MMEIDAFVIALEFDLAAAGAIAVLSRCEFWEFER